MRKPPGTLVRDYASLALLAALSGPASAAWQLEGSKTLAMHTREGSTVPIGTVTFVPEGDHYRFSLKLDASRFTDYFLSMKEFKCLESPAEIQCHVPYPYTNPGTVKSDDFAWLEHALLFLFKAPRDFGARLWNGVYYRMEIADDGIVGTPQAIDLNLISAPPNDPSTPPFGPAERSDIAPDSRWFSGLSIR
ncbi:MAG: hypothetical protein R3E45_12915 [Rhodocyclaceae bacterium]|nr:hypothetical protein [Rhodocyclaceae bacterium]MCP5308741.1 hypothetical protein [Zoogloeaceae bacterium]